jgi:hypothetical protein
LDLHVWVDVPSEEALVDFAWPGTDSMGKYGRLETECLVESLMSTAGMGLFLYPVHILTVVDAGYRPRLKAERLHFGRFAQCAFSPARSGHLLRKDRDQSLSKNQDEETQWKFLGAWPLRADRLAVMPLHFWYTAGSIATPVVAPQLDFKFSFAQKSTQESLDAKRPR